MHKRHLCREEDGRHRFLQGHPVRRKAARRGPALEGAREVIPNDGVYEAYSYAKAPVQAPGDPAAEYGTGEDCLYLNIWKADEAAAGNKPVMVWIYGGAFDVGGATDPQYDCSSFIRENPDVIAVTISYRVSFFGFFHLSHLPDGKDYSDAQNLGLLDQLMALKWVHENIAGFGGDPGNVTIFGESAGAASCSLLPLIKGAQQYFKRVISQSGAPAQTRSTEQAIAIEQHHEGAWLQDRRRPAEGQR